MAIRLLDTRTLMFRSFRTRSDPQVPRFAILSHTWGADSDEATYHSFQAAFSNGQVPRNLNYGFRKILSFCRRAAADGFDYVWVDTCCIDKTNDSELTEAVNSMFRWYQESTVCYVYLVDVPSDDDLNAAGSAFRQSRWFTRGWTLQELIAPRSVVFYSREWQQLGTKVSLRRTISEITTIDEHVLDTGDISTASVSMKLSWAATRSTTRVEDHAYCLLGFFNISMPLIYGEREQAFRRLLEEIAEQYSDQTIFSWVGDGRPSGMLATSPSQYMPARDASAANPTLRNPVFRLGNRGVQISLPLIPLPLRNLYAMVLNCFPASSNNSDSLLVQFIYRVHDDHNDYVRVLNDEVATYPVALKASQPSLLTTKEVFIGQARNPDFSMNRKVMFCLGRYPYSNSSPAVSVLGPADTVNSFSAIPQRRDQPALITMQLDDKMPSAVVLFRNREGRQIAACLTLWGHEIKVGLTADAADGDDDNDMSQVADAFLFGKKPMALKQPGTFTVQAPPRGTKRASLTLDEPVVDAALGTVCHVRLDAARDFWLHAIGPGVWPGCWTRYFDALAAAKPVKKRTRMFGR